MGTDRNHQMNFYRNLTRTKTKKVAWFVSHCSTESGRELYVRELQKHIEVDVYGACGPLKCPQYELDCCKIQF